VQKKPGLSYYAANPNEAVDSLKSLLDDAINVVPVEKRSETPVRLGVILF
jgi:apyrase